MATISRHLTIHSSAPAERLGCTKIALGHHLDDLIDVEPRPLSEVDTFGEPLDDSSDADLIDHLRELAGARIAEPDARLRKRCDDRQAPGPGPALALGAAHLAVLGGDDGGATVPPGDGHPGFADEVLLLREGRVVQRGAFTDLLERPAEDFVTRFVSAQRLGLGGEAS